MSAYKPSVPGVVLQLEEKLWLPGREGIEFIFLRQIIRLEADVNYTRVYLTNKEKLLAARTLKYFEGKLQHFGFIRVHQHNLVNFYYAKRFTYGKSVHLLMHNGDIVRVSQSGKKKLRELLKW